MTALVYYCALAEDASLLQLHLIEEHDSIKEYIFFYASFLSGFVAYSVYVPKYRSAHACLLWTMIYEISLKQLLRMTLLQQRYPKSVYQNYGVSGNANRPMISFMGIE